MQKTAMLIMVMMAAVPHLILLIVLLCSAMMAIRLMMICMRSCTSKTQKKRMKKSTGTLQAVSQSLVPPHQPSSTLPATHVDLTTSSIQIQPMTMMPTLATISPHSM